MEVSSHARGTPSWADVTSPRIEKTAAFYAGLFGWHADDQGAEAGHYTMFRLKGKNVAACTPPTSSDAPPVWLTYFTVGDVDETMATIHANGGSRLVDPMDVFDAGRMAVAADPSGGVFALWQARATVGAELVNEPGAMCWNELSARDADELLRFYSTVFGWEVVIQGGEGAPFTYRELHLAGRPVAGCVEMDDSWPTEIPTHWMVYFAVDDCDATAARAAELGGAVNVDPFDLPMGRTAVLSDPAGAHFSVIRLAQPSGGAS